MRFLVRRQRIKSRPIKKFDKPFKVNLGIENCCSRYYWIIYDRKTSLPVCHGPNARELSKQLNYDPTFIYKSYYRQLKEPERVRFGFLADYYIERIELHELER